MVSTPARPARRECRDERSAAGSGGRTARIPTDGGPGLRGPVAVAAELRTTRPRGRTPPTPARKKLSVSRSPAGGARSLPVHHLGESTAILRPSRARRGRCNLLHAIVLRPPIPLPGGEARARLAGQNAARPRRSASVTPRKAAPRGAFRGTGDLANGAECLIRWLFRTTNLGFSARVVLFIDAGAVDCRPFRNPKEGGLR